MDGETVTLTVKVPRDEFWQSVIGSAWESWPWWGVGVTEKQYEDSHSTVKVKAWQPDREGRPFTYEKSVNITDLTNAYCRAIEEGYVDTCTGKPLNWQELDACGGDVVLQLAVYGQVIWG